MADTQKTEPVGAARFQAVSYPATQGATEELTLASLNARLTALEAVVHALAPGVGDKHNIVPQWLEDIGARIRSVAKRL